MRVRRSFLIFIFFNGFRKATLGEKRSWAILTEDSLDEGYEFHITKMKGTKEEVLRMRVLRQRWESSKRFEHKESNDENPQVLC